MGLGLTLKKTEWGSCFYLQGAQREMGEASKHSIVTWSLPMHFAPGWDPRVPALHVSQPHCTVILERHRARGHQSLEAVQRSLGTTTSPGPSLSLESKRVLDGEPSLRIAMLMDGPRRQFFLSKQYTCAFSLWGQVLTGVPAVLYLLSCCHLSTFPDKWTHFTAWVTHDCFRKPRLAQCSKGEK